MAKSARSSNLKKNKSQLRKKVFGPVEQARAERLNKKLLELTQQSKPADAARMDVDADSTQVQDIDSTTPATSNPDARSNTAIKKARDAKKNKIEKKKFRKERNRITFKKHPMKSKR